MRTIHQIAEEEGAVKSFVSQGYYLLDNATLERFAARIRAEQKDECEVNIYSSRMCERGTKSCTKKHASPESDIDQATRTT